MNVKEEKLLKLSEEKNGHMTSQDLFACGFTKFDVAQFVKKGLLERISRGKYIHADAFEDEFYLVQQNNSSKMIYSNETALYLHDMTGRFPSEFTVTTQQGYHLRNQDLKIYYVKKEHLLLGAMEMSSNNGNPIMVYDKERTVCDIIRNQKRIETQVYVEGLQEYFLNGKPDLKKLSRYAKELGVFEKVMNVVMLYMAP